MAVHPWQLALTRKWDAMLWERRQDRAYIPAEAMVPDAIASHVARWFGTEAFGL